MEWISESVEKTNEIAAEFANKLCAGDVVAFFGEVGAGKTHFVKGLAQVLCPQADVVSPTFTIVNEYLGGRLPLYHFDMYRIESFDDLYSTGFFDYLETGGVCLIEWSENIEGALPEPHYEVHIEKLGEQSRKITIFKKERADA